MVAVIFRYLNWIDSLRMLLEGNGSSALLFVWCSKDFHIQANVEQWEEKSAACRDEHSHHALMSRSELAEIVQAHLVVCKLLTCGDVKRTFLHQRKQH